MINHHYQARPQEGGASITEKCYSRLVKIVQPLPPSLEGGIDPPPLRMSLIIIVIFSKNNEISSFNMSCRWENKGLN